GRVEELSPAIRHELQEAMVATRGNTGLLFNIALSYGGRAEIVDAVNRILADRRLPDGIRTPLDEAAFARYLYTAGQPDPDLLIPHEARPVRGDLPPRVLVHRQAPVPRRVRHPGRGRRAAGAEGAVPLRLGSRPPLPSCARRGDRAHDHGLLRVRPIRPAVRARLRPSGP